MVSKEEINQEYEMNYKAGACPEKLYKIHLFLNDLGLCHLYPYNNIISVLDIPDNMLDIVLNKTHSLNLMITLHVKKTAIYSGYFRMRKDFEGFRLGEIKFFIQEAPDNFDTTKINYEEDIRW